jgi:hypothetical protein
MEEARVQNSPIAQPAGQRRVARAALVHDSLVDPGLGVLRFVIAGSPILQMRAPKLPRRARIDAGRGAEWPSAEIAFLGLSLSARHGCCMATAHAWTYLKTPADKREKRTQ